MDLERMRQKLEELKNPSWKGNSKIWKPSEEEAKIRLIEYPFGEDPFVELFFHYGIGKGPSILCPKKNFGKTCPICEFAIANKDSVTTEEEKKEFKKLWPKQRIFAAILDRADETPVLKYWGFGVQVYELLIGHLFESDVGHYMNSEKGIDILIRQIKKGNKPWPETIFRFDRSDSPLLKTKKEREELLSKLEPIDEIFKPTTSSDIKKRLEEYLSAAEGDDDTDANVQEDVVRGGGNSGLDSEKLDKDLEKALADI